MINDVHGFTILLLSSQAKEISLDSEPETAEAPRPSQLLSRLPRRASYQPSVAELVKRYQEYLPPTGVEELAKTAMAPNVPVSESDQEGAPPMAAYTRPRVRSKTRGQMLTKRSSVSDFESSYAANIAPKYLTHSRRSLGQPVHTTRIPGPVNQSAESQEPSRRTSPDKRPSVSRLPTDSTIKGPGPFLPKGKNRLSASRASIKEDKMRTVRPGTTRRPTGTVNKVTSIAKHFERIGRENERANRRYAVIRGRRARPVATARAKVEILDSIKDAINDEDDSEGSDSSEADDEGGDEDDTHPRKLVVGGPSSSLTSATSESPESSAPPIEAPPAAVTLTAPAMAEEGPKGEELLRPATPLEPASQPASPALAALPATPAASPPAELDLGSAGPERVSILKTLAGLWPQQAQPSRLIDADDPMSDPEHIFRDSSMVVRTDEPTSIIALALK